MQYDLNKKENRGIQTDHQTYLSSNTNEYSTQESSDCAVMFHVK